MKKVITATPVNNDNGKIKFELPLPSQCPICEVAYAESPKEAYYTCDRHHGTSIVRVYTTYFCPHCEEMFFVVYYVGGNIFEQSHHGFISEMYPKSTATTEFSEYISSLSDRFIEIYHQAEKAEKDGLSEICGMGYRKAVEILIKDYAIWKYPDEQDKIKGMLLSQCIQNYIENADIRALATGCAWIGNDETHYTRIHEERCVDDLKVFIQALVQYINLMIAVDDAASLISKKK